MHIRATIDTLTGVVTLDDPGQGFAVTACVTKMPVSSDDEGRFQQRLAEQRRWARPIGKSAYEQDLDARCDRNRQMWADYYRRGGR